MTDNVVQIVPTKSVSIDFCGRRICLQVRRYPFSMWSHYELKNLEAVNKYQNDSSAENFKYFEKVALDCARDFIHSITSEAGEIVEFRTQDNIFIKANASSVVEFDGKKYPRLNDEAFLILSEYINPLELRNLVTSVLSPTLEDKKKSDSHSEPEAINNSTATPAQTT